AAADRALAAARAAGDAVGEAQAQRERALRLQELDRAAEAGVAWKEAAAAWTKTGDGPGQVEALAGQALLALRNDPEKRRALLRQAMEVAQAEKKRPLAAASGLNDFGRRLRE